MNILECYKPHRMGKNRNKKGENDDLLYFWNVSDLRSHAFYRPRGLGRFVIYDWYDRIFYFVATVICLSSKDIFKKKVLDRKTK